MRTDLLGLELDDALAMLEKEGIVPDVTQTAAPKKTDREGKLRVVFAGDDGKVLIAARFVDPVADGRTGE